MLTHFAVPAIAVGSRRGLSEAYRVAPGVGSADGPGAGRANEVYKETPHGMCSTWKDHVNATEETCSGQAAPGERLIPCLLLVVAFHRRIITGLTEGLVKG